MVIASALGACCTARTLGVHGKNFGPHSLLDTDRGSQDAPKEYRLAVNARGCVLDRNSSDINSSRRTFVMYHGTTWRNWQRLGVTCRNGNPGYL